MSLPTKIKNIISQKPWNIIIITLSVLLFLFSLFYEYVFFVNNTEQDEIKFENTVEKTTNEINNHFLIKEQTLLGIIGFFKSSNVVTPGEWDEYIKEIKIKKFFPNTIYVGLWEYLFIDTNKKDKSPAEILKDKTILEYDSNDIINLGEGFYFKDRKEFFAKKYTTIFNEELEKIPLNQIDKPNMTDIMKSVRKNTLNGQADISLFYLKNKKVFSVVFLPLYKKGYNFKLGDDLTNELNGWVLLKFNLKSLLNDFGGKYDIKIHKVTDLNVNETIYTNDVVISSKTLKQDKIINILNHPIKISWVSLPEFREKQRSGVTLIIVAILLTIIIFTVVIVWAHSLGKKSKKLAEKMTYKYQISDKKLKKQNKELEKTFKELQIYDKEKDEFLAIASHELRTPMTIIRGYLSLFLDGSFGKVPKKQKTYLEKIDKNTENLISLVNNMLDIRKLDTQKTKINIENINIINFLNEISSDMDKIFAEKNITLTVKNKLNTKNKNIKIDKNLMKEVLTNLLGNSQKFTKENGNVSIILQESKKSKKYLDITIKDNGVGIPLKHQHKIWNKFYQVDNSLQRDYNGTGLGLYIVKIIIEKHKGKIWIKSGIGKGTEFHIELKI